MRSREPCSRFVCQRTCRRDCASANDRELWQRDLAPPACIQALNPLPACFDPEFLANVELANQTYHRQFQGHAVSFTAFRQAPWYQYGLLALEQTQLSIRSPFLDNDLVRTAFRAPSSEIVKGDIFEDNNDCSRLIADGNGTLHGIPTDRGLGGTGGWMAPDFSWAA